MTAPQQPPALPDLSDLIGAEPRPRRPLPRRVLVAAGAVLVAVAVALGGFLAGRASAGGPATLADAVQLAAGGKLPCGNAPAALCNGLGRFGGSGSGRGFGGQGRVGQGPGGLGGLFGPGTVTGTITGVSGTALQVQTRAGTISVALPTGVQIRTTSAGTTRDLTTGRVVVVTATTDGNSNRTAQRILVLPAPS